MGSLNVQGTSCGILVLLVVGKCLSQAFVASWVYLQHPFPNFAGGSAH